MNKTNKKLYSLLPKVLRPGYAYGVSRRGFKVHPEKKTWKEAAKTCHLEGGELVKGDSPAVNAWLAKQDPKLGVLWVGATDEVCPKYGLYNL